MLNNHLKAILLLAIVTLTCVSFVNFRKSKGSSIIMDYDVGEGLNGKIKSVLTTKFLSSNDSGVNYFKKKPVFISTKLYNRDGNLIENTKIFLGLDSEKTSTFSSKKETFQYDSDGILVSSTDIFTNKNKNEQTEFTYKHKYDSAKNHLEISKYDSTQKLIERLDYIYDKASNLVRKDVFRFASWSGEIKLYKYDDKKRIIEIIDSSKKKFIKDNSYKLDRHGNKTSETEFSLSRKSKVDIDYKILQKDKNKNWTKRITNCSFSMSYLMSANVNLKFLETREITYY